MDTYTEKRSNSALRAQFNRAYNSLALILPCYQSTDRFQVFQGYLKTYDLLKGNDSAKGRLLHKLDWIF